MPISADQVRRIFCGLEHGDGMDFFDYVAESVDWTVQGTHPLAGRYRSKQDFLAHTVQRLGRVLPDGTQLKVGQVLGDGNWAAVELRSDATARNGLEFDNRFCWVIRFDGDRIVEMQAYLDSALVQRVLDENEA